MSTVNSAGSNLANLLQTLSKELPQMTSVLSSPKVKTALENASPHDIVELSEAALKLQHVGSLFGGLSPTADSLFQALEANAASNNSSNAGANPLLNKFTS